MNDLGLNLHNYGTTTEPLTFLEAVKAEWDRTGSLIANNSYFDRNFKPGPADSPVFGVVRHTPTEVFSNMELDFSGLDNPDDFGEFAKQGLIDHFILHFLQGDQDHPTLVLHSSGYDSRILSSCLMELREAGYDLGDIHFRCHGPEGPTFKQIMELQGWEPDEFSVFEHPPEDHFDMCRWDRPGVGGWTRATAPMNFWRDIVPEDEEKDWNMIGGSGGGEASEYPAIGKAPFIDWTFSRNHNINRWLQYFPDGTEFVANTEDRFRKAFFPFFSDAHMYSVACLPTTLFHFEDNGCDAARASILRRFRTSTLDIPRAGRTYNFTISDERWETMRSGYEWSYFRMNMGGPDTAQILPVLKKTPGAWEGRIWRLAAVIERAIQG